jgi:hypothetical protein
MKSGHSTLFDELCLIMIVAQAGACPTFKNVTCFVRWAKAHSTLPWSFGTETSAGMKYGGPGNRN